MAQRCCAGLVAVGLDAQNAAHFFKQVGAAEFFDHVDGINLADLFTINDGGSSSASSWL